MERDHIIEVGIDDNKRIYVKPETQKFPVMYREAVEVNWNEEKHYLFSPKPRKWSYTDWFLHIVSAAKLQSCELFISEKTCWKNISEKLKVETLNQYHAANT